MGVEKNSAASGVLKFAPALIQAEEKNLWLRFREGILDIPVLVNTEHVINRLCQWKRDIGDIGSCMRCLVEFLTPLSDRGRKFAVSRQRLWTVVTITVELSTTHLHVRGFTVGSRRYCCDLSCIKGFVSLN